MVDHIGRAIYNACQNRNTTFLYYITPKLWNNFSLLILQRSKAKKKILILRKSFVSSLLLFNTKKNINLLFCIQYLLYSLIKNTS